MTEKPATPPPSFPTAELKPARESRFWSWLPWIALCFVTVLLIQTWWEAGPFITVRFTDGYGLKTGNALRYRGIDIGDIREIMLSGNLDSVLVKIRLLPHARDFAREGSRFWIVRPQVSLYEVQGMDTVVGAHYIAGLPGSGSSRFEFNGLESPPVQKKGAENGLEIVLLASRRGSIRPGMPVLYRQIQVGSVLSTGLMKDATGVEIRAAIDSPYASLIRENTRFWNSSGIALNLGFLKGINLDVDSLQSILAGGISLAVPDDPGPPVKAGHRFILAESSEKEWHTWHPSFPLFGAPGQPLPEGVKPIRAQISERESLIGGFFSLSVQTQCLVIPIEQGYLGPSDILSSGKAVFYLASHPARLPGEVEKLGPFLALLKFPPSQPFWPKERLRQLALPLHEPTGEGSTPGNASGKVLFDGVTVYGENPARPWCIPSSRLASGPLQIDVVWESLISTQWHGAMVTSPEGHFIGVFLVQPDGRGIIAPIPGALLAAPAAK